jgi:hypothetical protein
MLYTWNMSSLEIATRFFRAQYILPVPQEDKTLTREVVQRSAAFDKSQEESGIYMEQHSDASP